jgi:hypothetical protein
MVVRADPIRLQEMIIRLEAAYSVGNNNYPLTINDAKIDLDRMDSKIHPTTTLTGRSWIQYIGRSGQGNAARCSKMLASCCFALALPANVLNPTSTGDFCCEVLLLSN